MGRGCWSRPKRREFDGILKRFGNRCEARLAGAQFAWRSRSGDGDRWLLVANGPGAALVTEAFEEKKDVDGIISTGFCGALDPALRVGDIVVCGDVPLRVAIRAR